MTVKYSITFEFATRPSVTATGTVKALAAATCASRAIKEAQKALKPVAWTSVVCVLLERVPDASAP